MLRTFFKIGDIEFEMHLCPLTGLGTEYMDKFITEEMAEKLPVQVPKEGNHIFFRQEGTKCTFTVAFIRNIECREESERYAKALIQLMKYRHSVTKGGPHEMEGLMVCNGYRDDPKHQDPPGDYANRKGDADLEHWQSEWQSFVESLQKALNTHFPCQSLESAQAQHLYDTPTMGKHTWMGNLTVTFNFAVVTHKDRDVSWAIGM